MKTRHQINLEKINDSQKKKEKLAKDTVEKVKSHTSKVATVVQSKKEKEAQDLKNKEQGLE